MTQRVSAVVFVAAALVSGLLAVLSIAPFDLGVLAWVCVSPLLLVLRGRSALAAAGLGFLFGFVYATGGFFWLSAVPSVTPSRFLLLRIGLSLSYVAFALLYTRIAGAVGRWIVLAGPALWVALDYLRANSGFLSLPWNFLGHSQYRYLPIIQIADVTGVYGISLLLLMVNELVSGGLEALLRRRHGFLWTHRVPLIGVACVLVLALGYGWHRLRAPEGPPRLRVAIVQGNVIARSNMTVREQTQHLRAYLALTKEVAAERPEIIIWPSSSLAAPISALQVSYFLAKAAREADAYLLVGGAGGEKFVPARDGQLAYSNSEFLIAPSGQVVRQYNKIHLTPFTEYVPLQGRVQWPSWMTSAKYSFARGDSYTIFEVSGARFGVTICWESLFPDLFRRFVMEGANFMVNATNEAVFGAAGPRQTLAMNVFRAVENRVVLARAATTGVSALIDPKGRITARVAENGKATHVAGFLVANVPLATDRTFYTAYGDVFAQAMSAVAAAALVLALLGARGPAWVVGRQAT